MAITINSQPGTSTPIPAYRAIRYDVSSNDANIVNIIADIYIDATFVTYLTVQVDGTGKAIFDIRNIVQSHIAANQISNNYDLPAIGEATNADNAVDDYDASIQLKLFEETEQADGTLTSNWAADGAGTEDASTNTAIVIPAALQHDGPSDLTDYVIEYAASNRTQKFLTNGPSSQYVTSTDDAFLFAYFGDTNFPAQELSDSAFLRIKKYNSSDSLLGTLDVETTTSDAVVALAIGPANINANSAGFIDSNVSYYTVQFYFDDNSAGTFTGSELRTFNILRNCDDAVRVHWYNRMGGWDSFTFQQGKDANLEVRKEAMEKYVPYNFTSITPDKEILSVKAHKIYATRAINLTDSEVEWLEEMLTSPKVFTDESSRYAMMILADTYEVDNEDETPSVSIAYRLFDIITQRN